MEKETGSWIIGILLVVLMVINIFGFMAMSDREVKVNVDLSAQNTAITELGNIMKEIVSTLEVSDFEEVIVEEQEYTGDYMLSKSEYENQVIEEKAEEMALIEIDSRDFKRAVFDALENYSVDIESYKDIIEMKVMDIDVDNEVVTLDMKIYYFLDGDEDETERARLSEFTITINDLDFDELDDAEVNEDYLDTLEVLKVYS